jgi:hypothetical protein
MHERKRERAARTTKDLRWNPRSQGEKKGWPVSGKAMLKNANVMLQRGRETTPKLLARVKTRKTKDLGRRLRMEGNDTLTIGHHVNN